MNLPYLTTTCVEELLDKFAVQELIEYERFCRDNRLWDDMRRCFAPDSTVTVSWYQGTGYGFVEESSKMQVCAPHRINNVLVWLNGDRAVAVVMAGIQPRKHLNGRAYDLTSYVRLLYRTEKIDGRWKIRSLDCIYERDSLVPVIPDEFPCPEHNGRSSYSALAAVMESEGYAINMELPGDDRPEQTAELMQSARSWLERNS